NIAFLNTLGLVLPESAMQIYGCHQIDGIIGSNMLRKSIIQFDSENKQIILTNNPENLELKNINYQKMTLTKNQSSPFIQVILKKGDKDASINTLFDTGNNGFFDITT